MLEIRTKSTLKSTWQLVAMPGPSKIVIPPFFLSSKLSVIIKTFTNCTNVINHAYFCNILLIDSELSLSLVIETLLFLYTVIQLWKCLIWTNSQQASSYQPSLHYQSSFPYLFHPHYSHQFQPNGPHQNQATPHYQFQSSQQCHPCHMIADY